MAESDLLASASSTVTLEFLQKLEAHDPVCIALETTRRRVLETVASLMRYYTDCPNIIDRLRLLIDCISSVAHPEIDFKAMAGEAYAQFKQEGLHLVKAADRIE